MSAGAPPPPLGRQVLERGWRQGALLVTPGPLHAWNRRNTGAASRWEVVTEERPADTGWVLASQDCDIAAKDEHRVELLGTFWSTDKGLLRAARLNSARRFLLLQRQGAPGRPEGLVADATVRLLLEKHSLLELAPASQWEWRGQRELQRFREWLARRYNRPAIANALVDAVQKPLVEALRKLKDEDELWQWLDGTEEVLYAATGAVAPFEVSLLFVRKQGAREDPLGEAEVLGWVAEVLNTAGLARLAAGAFRGMDAISLADYRVMERLTLDEFSLED